MDFSSTFSLFFSDEDEKRECIDCGATEDLTPHGSATAGPQMWICPACKAKRDQESADRAAKAADRIAEWNARDEWEEG